MREGYQTGVRISDATIYIERDLIKENIADMYTVIQGHSFDPQDSVLTVDLNRVMQMDSAGVALLNELKQFAKISGLQFQITNSSDSLHRLMSTFSSGEQDIDELIAVKETLLEKMGDMVYHSWQHVSDFFILVADTAYYAVWGLYHKGGTRKGEFIKQCIQIGMNALPIVGLISFLIGFILALQAAAQLRQFGASIFVADLVAISMTREMGPIMTAIALAGRSGSAFASEIANMVVTEETDALKTMGLDPIQYVVVPKVYAITLTTPMLTILSMLIGIFGSLIIGITYLNIGVRPFLNEVANVLIFRDIIIGLVKSILFAWIIVTVGAYYGFNVKGGAEGVGRATTASVVTSIFLVILADSLMGLIFYFGAGAEI